MIGGGLHFAINSITQPFFALFAAELGASTSSIGALLMLRAVLPLFIAMPSGQLIDRLGAVPMLRFGNLLTIGSLLLMIWSPSLAVLTASQLLIGAGSMIVSSALQVIVSEGDKAARERDISRYSAWCSGGSMIGPLIGGGVVTAVSSYGAWAEADGYRAAFFISLLAAAVFALAFQWVSRRTERRERLGAAVKDVLRPREIADSYLKGAHLLKHSRVQFGLVGTFLIHFIQAIWAGFFPLYLDTLGYSAFLISVLVSLRGLAGMVSRMFVPWLTRRRTHQSILIQAGCIAAVCLIGLPVMDWHIVPLALVTLLLGSSVGINMPVSTMIMVDEDTMAERGKIMGLRLLANRTSQIVAPMLFGVFGQILGLSIAFYAGGGMLLASLLGFSLYRKRREGLSTIQRMEVEK